VTLALLARGISPCGTDRLPVLPSAARSLLPSRSGYDEVHQMMRALAELRSGDRE
jgi:hypothetical protein